MIGLDTNVLARYYVADAGDADSEAQREAARRLIESGKPLSVCKTVLLELEWVMRGHYEFSPAQIQPVLRHLLAQPHIAIEDRANVERALAHYTKGLDFADALHHASYGDCQSMASFDDRRFARRAKRLGLIPVVSVPG
ncbi:type II toxin-antitoxin system VapC family toxin [Nevskia sp.]|uniref:type II toxin-antitoxin system VapC family toxin n=1 Tax=Nevskia sp. TaxID=1929292 RepID=UPI0025D637B1|nr:type II toxin-antitoxin system VapC family toxin [Nevskia sp.]